jgi:hypothetical protein
VISPDGSAVLYRGSDGYYVRRLDSLESKLVPGSSTANNPAFWSPDSTTVVYPSQGQGQLTKVRVPDGAPLKIAELRTPSRSGSWADSGAILFSAQSGTLLTVPAAGGELKPVALEEPLAGGRVNFPEFLPGSEDFLLMGRGHNREEDAIYLASYRDGKALHPVLLARNETPARYTPAGGGRVLFIRNDNLYSQRLNLSGRKLEGEAELLVAGVASGGTSDFSVSRNGTIAWRPGTGAQSQLTEFDREGNVIGTPGPMVGGSDLAISPDGKELLVYDRPEFLMNVGQTGHIELPKDVRWYGWAAGGSKLIGRRGDALVEMPSPSGEVRELRQIKQVGFESLSDDGKRIVAETETGLLTFAIEVPPDEVKPRAINGRMATPLLSQDGRWVLYGSEGLYIQPFPVPGPRRQIAASGSHQVWRGDGKEVLYYDGGSLMSVTVTGGASPAFGAPRKLFSGLHMPPSAVLRSSPLAVSPDGSRIYWLQGVVRPESNVIHVKIGAVK